MEKGSSCTQKIWWTWATATNFQTFALHSWQHLGEKITNHITEAMKTNLYADTKVASFCSYPRKNLRQHHYNLLIGGDNQTSLPVFCRLNSSIWMCFKKLPSGLRIWINVPYTQQEKKIKISNGNFWLQK